MKIAAVVITHNEEFRLNRWINYHEKYKDLLYMHIIVDNNSDLSYHDKLKKAFINSVIIRNTDNIGSTGAYNAGIRHALSFPEVDSILLIGNDIEIESNGLSQLYQLLFSEKDISVVVPVLLQANSSKIESFGIKINPNNLRFLHQYVDKDISEIKTPAVLSDSFPGAMYLAKRSFFEILGLLDEKLFMYAEEIDLGIRAKAHNLKIVVTSTVKAWHQHVNKGNKKSRSSLAGYLQGRNDLIIARKYYKRGIILRTGLTRLFLAIRSIAGAFIKKRSIDAVVYSFFYLFGVLAGIFKYYKIPATLIKKNRF